MLWIVVPAWNEAENLAELIPRILENLRLIDAGGQLLVVDDGSRDATAEVVTKLAADDAGIHLASHGRNKGKAAALKLGFGLALDGGATRIVMMDADGQDDPAELVRLVAELEGGADLVTGARLERHDRFVKRNTSKIYNRVTGALSGAPGRDFNSGYKAMRAAVARDVAPMMYGELHRYLTVMVHWLGYRTSEIEVQHHERMHGKSKYGLARFWRGFVDLLTVRFLMSYEHRPSHLFSGIGATSFALGGLGLLYLTGVKLSGGAIGGRPLLIAAVLLVLVGLQLILFGLLAELVVYSRNRDRQDQR
jgi:glycosyltransferase involved in cell wall biosynthesis